MEPDTYMDPDETARRFAILRRALYHYNVDLTSPMITPPQRAYARQHILECELWLAEIRDALTKQVIKNIDELP